MQSQKALSSSGALVFKSLSLQTATFALGTTGQTMADVKIWGFDLDYNSQIYRARSHSVSLI